MARMKRMLVTIITVTISFGLMACTPSHNQQVMNSYVDNMEEQGLDEDVAEAIAYAGKNGQKLASTYYGNDIDLVIDMETGKEYFAAHGTVKYQEKRGKHSTTVTDDYLIGITPRNDENGEQMTSPEWVHWQVAKTELNETK